MLFCFVEQNGAMLTERLVGPAVRNHVYNYYMDLNWKAGNERLVKPAWWEPCIKINPIKGCFTSPNKNIGSNVCAHSSEKDASPPREYKC